ncbi:PepSY domain-containing protein [Paracoccaceae bacterium Fryx2]|nr:PepSY domain-containing protein [Paracoccaceae bacterium Fryx2]
MKQSALRALALAALMATAMPVAAHDLPAETVDAITRALADIQCQMDPDDIEVKDGGYALDDVFCADGQYDMKMDAAFAVTEKTKE